jgi:hypothetical protein
MGDEGIEHPPLAGSKRPISENSSESGTDSGTLDGESADSDDSDPDLQLVIQRWPGLAPELRAAIVRMVK